MLTLVGRIIRHDLFGRPHFLRNYSFALHEVGLLFKKLFAKSLSPQFTSVVVRSDGLIFVLGKLFKQIELLEEHLQPFVATKGHGFELPFVPPVDCE